jgi:hypothetical protein
MTRLATAFGLAVAFALIGTGMASSQPGGPAWIALPDYERTPGRIWAIQVWMDRPMDRGAIAVAAGHKNSVRTREQRTFSVIADRKEGGTRGGKAHTCQSAAG